MLTNYIKIAWRNFTQNKLYSLINIWGLAIGFTCLILIMRFVTDELSYDSFHENKDRIHFVARKSSFGQGTDKSLSTPFPLGKTMGESIPEVENYVTTTWPGNGTFSLDGKEFKEDKRIIQATANFFQIFSFSLSQGDPQSVLAEPNSVVITQKFAGKYFNGENPIGKPIVLDRYGQHEYTITGIAENPPKNSYLDFDLVSSIEELDNVKSNRDSWNSSMYHTYVLLQPGASWKKIKGEVIHMITTNMDDDPKTTFFSIPIDGLYLSDLVQQAGFKGSMKYIYIFSAIGFFILLLACINYMNLATARATRRSKEVGVRKVVGAGRGQLIYQFIGEAVIISIFAFILGLIVAQMALPLFNQFVGKEMTLDFRHNSVFMVSLSGLAILVGIISGSYPAIYLSGFKPLGSLRTGASGRLTGSTLRKGLVIFQFAISTFLVMGTLVIFNQMQFVLNKDLGFEHEQVLYIPFGASSGKIESFKQKALTQSGVLKVAGANAIPGRFYMRMSMPFDPKQPEKQYSAHAIRVDADYDDVLKLKMATGRFFSAERPSDREKGIVINEAMVDELGWESPQKAIGHAWSDDKEVIGVVKNFNFESLHNKIKPVFMGMAPNDSQYNQYSMLVVRFNPGQTSRILQSLKREWNAHVSGEPMNYHFLDDEFAQLYETDRKLSRAITVFALLAILIACMGLFGLAAYTAERRTKEIGVRKVLGATVTNIVILLSKDFIKLVIIGFAIGVPIAWYAMNKWLADFAYKINIGLGIFLLAGGLALLIALATVSWQSIRAALANPVDSLRSE